jgi:hypothetical protein
MNPGPRPKTLESWLRRMVREDAVTIRCILEDDSEKKIKVELKGQRPRVADLMRTIASFSCAKLEALSAQGEVLAVWECEASDPDAPGYTKDPSDTTEERMLKTFAHLLADAYKHAQKQLVEVVSIQSASFAEERKHLSTAVQASDRLVRRVRVASASDIEGNGESKDDNFLATLLGPMLQGMIRKEVAGGGVVEEPEETNGAAKETPE